MTSLKCRVTIFGGMGFIGSHLVPVLLKRGHQVTLAVRAHDAVPIEPRGESIQFKLKHVDTSKPASIIAACGEADAIVDMLRIPLQKPNQIEDAARLNGSIAQAAATRKARMVYVSAIGAQKNAPALYSRWKWHAERAVLEVAPQATIIRPSIVFGRGNNIISKLARMAYVLPVLPLIAGGTSRFQPVYVGDVVTVLLDAIEGSTKAGTLYELGGPEILSLKEIFEFVLLTTQLRRLLIPLPYSLAQALAIILKWLPNSPITLDQVKLLGFENVVSKEAIDELRTFEGLSIQPTALNATTAQL